MYSDVDESICVMIDASELYILIQFMWPWHWIKAPGIWEAKTSATIISENF